MLMLECCVGIGPHDLYRLHKEKQESPVCLECQCGFLNLTLLQQDRNGGRGQSEMKSLILVVLGM